MRQNIYGSSGSPVAHKGQKLDPTGYINRSANKKKDLTTSNLSPTMRLQKAAQKKLMKIKKASSYTPR